MGVPRLFKYISDNYPDCIKKYRIKECAFAVDNLFFDANALIYNALNEITSEGMLPPYEGVEQEPIEDHIYRLFMERINEYVIMFPPRKLIYIAIDGCAPLGKQAQQRQRRYLSNGHNELFNRCAITPGTKFMLNLTRYINTDIRSRMMRDERWRRVRVYFSPPSVPGEGEHKLLDFIRKNHRTISKQNNCMYGPDGDLIMLGLATYCPNFHLVREDMNNSNIAVHIDIGTISEYITDSLKEEYSKAEDKDLINDFILLGFFVGNDFLPKIQMFHLLEEGVETMMTEYKKLLNKERSTITTKGVIDTKLFERFILSLGERENTLLQEQIELRVTDEKFLNVTLLECAVPTLSTQNGETRQYNRLDFNRYRISYYEKKLGIARDGLSQREYNENISRLCREYMNGIYWVFKYYTEGCPSVRWYYPYYYAPLFADFVNVFRMRWSPPSFTKEDLMFSSPFQQLLTILPKSSSYLLPPEYAAIMHDRSLEEFYVDTFDVDYEGKLKEYQGIVRLPFVDFQTIYKRYSEVSPKKKYTRNRVGKVFLFAYDRNKEIRYSSKYGNIYRCKIDVKKI